MAATEASATHPPFRELGDRLSNWGRWGANDRIGTLNHLTPECVVDAARLIRRGAIFDLGLDVNANGPQLGGFRANPVHVMTITPPDMAGNRHGLIAADDFIMMPLQSVTQWDGVGHIGYDNLFYNNISAETITTMGGSRELSIDQIAVKGIAGRGVLFDVAAHRGVDCMAAGDVIEIAELEEIERKQAVEVKPGDILLLRTGWIRQLLVHGSPETCWNGEPGLDHRCCAWLQDRQIAAIASDNWGVETSAPNQTGGFDEIYQPFHSIAIRDMGMTLGELFNLEELSKDCATDNIYEFFFTAPPLKITGGVGTPITPLAIK